MQHYCDIDTVLFDLDGTLVNSIGILQEVYFEFVAMHGAQGSMEEFNRLNGPSLKEIVEYLRTSYAIPLSAEEVMSAYMKLLQNTYSHHATPMDGAQDLLQSMQQRGLTLALVTSTPTLLVRCFTDRHDWNRFFKLIISGDQVSESKPSPAIYQLAVDELAVAKQRCIAIEDSVNGVKSASSAGLRVIGLAQSEAAAQCLRIAGADDVVPSLGSLHTLFTAQSVDK